MLERHKLQLSQIIYCTKFKSTTTCSRIKCYFILYYVILLFIVQSLIIMWLVSFATNPTLREGDYQYERGFIVLGWLITALVILVIIIGAILAIRDTDYSILEVSKAINLTTVNIKFRVNNVNKVS